jgi:4'-phosphopantetheinyl transferase
MNFALPGNPSSGYPESPGVSFWRPPPETLLLPEGQVHVWRISLEPHAEVLASLWQMLSADEQQRADRYHFARDRDWFIARRGRLRLLLGRYLGLDPASLQFSYNSYGKPALQPGLAGQVCFNISHSRGLALFALASQGDIGVDLEHLRSDIDHLALAERFFSAAERAELNALPLAIRQQAFFLCWTRKEAFIKAHGEGLSLPLDTFDVSLTPGQPARLLATRAGLEAPDQWSLSNLEPAPDYLAALAVRGQECELYCWAE